MDKRIDVCCDAIAVVSRRNGPTAAYLAKAGKSILEWQESIEAPGRNCARKVLAATRAGPAG